VVFIVLAASLPATITEHDLVVAAVLGVAFISIVLQGCLLTRYARRSFPELNASNGGSHENEVDSES
jgi:NhaP-type Na+/H+ or K+/H+ antiporter